MLIRAPTVVGASRLRVNCALVGVIKGWISQSARYNCGNHDIFVFVSAFETKGEKCNFHSHNVHLDIIGVFIYQLMHKSFALKEILIFTLKMLRHVWV